ncbi:hypothetical protein ACFO0N_17555 [Halobium salinum]|uniref:Uncharacterized protein n=1 Tax=Halobium salinum TaxID=1364940 RepID=A0ABD5PFW9_9EURY|nr:hypothetical protein [Halobium salinum]
MPALPPEADGRRLFGAVLLSALVTAAGFVALSWSRLLATGRVPDGGDGVLVGVVTGTALGAVSFVPFLLAVLLVVARPSRRSVAVGVGLVYATDLALAVGQSLLSGVPAGVGVVVLAVPLPRVASVLAVATAVWVAYHGGYERLASAAGNADQHPLFAIVADRRLGPGLSLRRGLVAAGLAAAVGVGGVALAGGVGEVLRAATQQGTVAVLPRGGAWSVGIPLARLPIRWLFEASFLLGVLFVTGPRLGGRAVLKAVAVVVGVQSAVRLLPALVPPFRPVELWAPSGPVLTPLDDLLLLVGVALAVRWGFRAGSDGHRPLTRSSRGAD